MNIARVALLALLSAGAGSASLAQVAAPPAATSSLFEAASNRKPAETVASGPGVVSSADVRASEAGAAMLRRGGSAADAAAATAIALTVVEPQSSGLGGGAFVLTHEAKGGRVTALDGRETAPAGATPERFLGPDGKPLPFREAVVSGRSVGVPGLVAVLAELHARQGRLPWAMLFEPAIALAADGIVVTPRLARIIAARREVLAASGAAAVFLNADGTPKKAGDRIVQPALAATLRAVAAGGPAAFYGGEVGAAISAAVAAAPRGPNSLTAADLSGYRVVQRTPLCFPYRQWRVCSMPPPSAGGYALAQMLAVMARHDVAKLGRDNALSWHLFAEAGRLAQADRAAWGADPGFAPVPVDGLTDPAYLAARAALVRPERAMPAVASGHPPGAPAAPAQVAGGGSGTSHVSAADAAGNVVSLTSTIESIFGSGQVAAGFFLNNELTDFDLAPVRADGRPAPNRVEPGKRPRSSMTPVLLYGPDGRLVAAIGAAGGATIIPQVAKTIIGIVDWKLPVEEAIALPMLFATPERVAVERGSRLEPMLATLKALGHNAVAADLPTKTNALVRDGSGWRGAGDARSEGQAVAARGRVRETR
ncbi:gamma-glutamyltransferase [Sandaracinobacteroides saxicola]|uniref:Glutathione hydrolase proenzyme n=1 Tax=Sandaracinobacteroides saxicola TaxID=2759707 RepID=A0A7G5IHY8_9SPHN|nr:gamma-glutamyltransferase [Sandaracinobacteroides saxicola]QMW22980.1 gamma-glutamyltransferase [Sandaracinobacteroides saxicola]